MYDQIQTHLLHFSCHVNKEAKLGTHYTRVRSLEWTMDWVCV